MFEGFHSLKLSGLDRGAHLHKKCIGGVRLVSDHSDVIAEGI